jgi:hypothetical protein
VDDLQLLLAIATKCTLFNIIMSTLQITNKYFQRDEKVRAIYISSFGNLRELAIRRGLEYPVSNLQVLQDYLTNLCSRKHSRQSSDISDSFSDDSLFIDSQEKRQAARKYYKLKQQIQGSSVSIILISILIIIF